MMKSAQEQNRRKNHFAMPTISVTPASEIKQETNEQYFHMSNQNPFRQSLIRKSRSMITAKSIVQKRMEFISTSNRRLELEFSDSKSYSKQMNLNFQESNDLQMEEDMLKSLNKDAQVNIEDVLFKMESVATSNHEIQFEEIQRIKNYSDLRTYELTKSLRGKNDELTEETKQTIALLGLLNIYQSQGYQLCLGPKGQQNQQEQQQGMLSNQDTIRVFQEQLIMTGQTIGLGYFKFHAQLNDLGKTPSQEEVSVSLKQDLCAEYGIQPGQILVIEAEVAPTIRTVTATFKVSDDASAQIVNQLKNPLKKVPQKCQSQQNIFQANQTKDQPKKLQKFKNFKNPSIKFSSMIDYFQISEDIFDRNYNMEWPENRFTGKIDYRGALVLADGSEVKQQYNFPIGWQGHGLNMSKLIASDKSEWFSMSHTSKTWIVLYHGTKGRFVNKIFQNDNYLKPGENNAYGGQKCRLTGKPIKSGKNENLYLSDLIADSDRYCDQDGFQIGDKKYKFIFQCRVNPHNVKSPASKPSYYTVDGAFAKESIRPYRLLLKEVKSQ